MRTGLCAKVVTTATLIATDGRRFVGMNWCANPQHTCPRTPGEDYSKCSTICGQYGHAEHMACLAAGTSAYGATLYLEGHTYACAKCTDDMHNFGVAEFIVGPPPPVENTQPLSVKP